MRMQMRRLTRLANAFSKKIENHCHSLALYFVWYNWVRLHKAHKLTPAMAAGITDKLMEIKDILALIDDAEMQATIQKRGADEELIEGLSSVCPRNTSALASASAFLTSY
jgi:hypothetical protein